MRTEHQLVSQHKCTVHRSDVVAMSDAQLLWAEAEAKVLRLVVTVEERMDQPAFARSNISLLL